MRGRDDRVTHEAPPGEAKLLMARRDAMNVASLGAALGAISLLGCEKARSSAEMADWNDTGVASGSLTTTETFLNYQALRDSNAHTSESAVVVLGHTLDGDGGGGIFFWKAASTAVDNSGTVLKPTAVAGSGRWLRIYTGDINVKWFGAVGNGIADDTPFVQAAISNTPAGGTLDLRGGKYKITQTISITGPLTVRSGEFVAQFATNAQIAVSIDNNDTLFAAHLRDISISNTSSTTAGHIGLALGRVLLGSFTRVNISNFGGSSGSSSGTGLRLKGTYLCRFEHCNISGNRYNVVFACYVRLSPPAVDACHVNTFDTCAFQQPEVSSVYIPADAAQSVGSTAVNTVFFRCLLQNGAPSGPYFDQTNGMYTTLEQCYFERPPPTPGLAIRFAGGSENNKILCCQFSSGNVEIGANIVNTLVSGNIAGSNIVFTDLAPSTTRIGNENWSNKFALPLPFQQIGKLQQKLQGTAFSDPAVSPVDNTRVVHLSDTGPFLREHLFKKPLSLGSFVEFLHLYVPENYACGYVTVHFITSSNADGKAYIGGTLNVVVGSRATGQTVTGALDVTHTRQIQPGGSAETLTSDFDVAVDSSGNPRIVRLRVKVTTTVQGITQAFIRGCAVIVCGRFNDGGIASTTEIGLRSP
jgi:hypothetical protein